MNANASLGKRLFWLLASVGLALGLLTALLGVLLGMGPWRGDFAQAAGTLRFVALGGTDTGDCSSAGSPCATIQYAVDQSTLDDEIRVAEGTYDTLNSDGGLSQVVYLDKSLILRGGFSTANWEVFDPEAQRTIIDAQAGGRGVAILGAVTPTVEGFYITNGDATALGGGPGGVDVGGGLYVFEADAVIRHNVIATNVASSGDVGYGGGLYLGSSSPQVLSNTIRANTGSTAASGSGGGIDMRDSSATVAYNAILDNVGTSADADGYGGGINAAGGAPQIRHNTLAGNVAVQIEPAAGREGQGGGLRLAPFTAAIVERNVISGNVASESLWGYGGGIYVDSSDDAQVRQNLLRNNRAASADSGYGGGIGVRDSGARFENNALVGNRSGEFTGSRGGALAVFGDRPIFAHTTVAQSSGGDNDNAVYITAGTGDAVAVMSNTLLSNESHGFEATSGDTLYLFTTLWDNVTTETDGLGTFYRDNDLYGFAWFAGDGYHLTEESAAIDQGFDAGVADDIDGQSRPQMGGYDVGADEFLLLTPDLVLGKVASPTVLSAGERLTYALTVSNTGNQAAAGVRLTDTLPAGVTFYTAMASQGTGCAESGGVLSCDLGALGAGAQAHVTSVVTATLAGTWVNEAVVDTTTPELDPENNFAMALVLVDTADVGVSKSAEPDPAFINLPLTYTLVITNDGPYAAPNAVVTDTLPGEVTFYTATASQGTGCALNELDVVCVLDTLDAGAVATVTLVVTPTVADTINNTAQVTSDAPDPNTENDSVSLLTDVFSTYAMAMDAAARALSAAPGEIVTYTLFLTNTGAVADTYDLLAYNAAWTTTVPASVGPLAAGAGAAFPVTVTVPVTAAHGEQDTVTVVASSRGDPAQEAIVDLTTTADAYAACTLELFAEPFDALALPTGWQNVDNLSGGQVWAFDDPGGRGNLTGGSGGFATVDSDAYGSGNSQDTELWTASFDLSAVPDAHLRFRSDFYDINAIADVDVSVNGGTNWTNIWRRTGSERGPYEAIVDLDTWAGQPNVMLRYHYYDATYDWWWQVDDVRVRSCTRFGVELTPPADAQSGVAGTDVVYTLAVTNTGTTTDTFTVQASDNAWTTTVPASIGPLAAGGSATFNVTVTVPAGAGDGAWDEATVVALSQGDAAQSDQAVLTTSAVGAGLALAKTPFEQIVPSGTPATFTLFITNTGGVALSGVVLDDPVTPDCDRSLGVLDAGQATSVTCTHPAVSDFLTNTAWVTGTPPAGPAVSASDSAAVILVPAQPAIALSKEPEAQTVPVGGAAAFTISVTNTGNVDLHSVTVLDPLATSCQSGLGTLAPGATQRYACLLTGVTADFTNTATVTAAEPVSATDAARVTTVNARIAIAKTPSTQAVPSGGTATFSIFITNTGVVTLTQVRVEDSIVPGCARAPGAIPDLAPGASYAYTCQDSSVLTGYSNVAMAIGQALGQPVSQQSAPAVVVISGGALQAEIRPAAQTVLSGTGAAYTVRVHNAGAENLRNLSTAFFEGFDGIVACSRNLGALAVGASKAYTCTGPAATAGFTASVHAEAQTYRGATVTALGHATVSVVPANSIGDRVWLDADADGVQDPGEGGVPTVTVRLYTGAGGFVAETRTDAAGAYAFAGLRPGAYFLTLDPPAGARFSPRDQGGDDALDSDVDPATGRTGSISLSAGAAITTVDAGLYRPASLGDRVWDDLDGDGAQDAGEPGLPGVTLKLYGSSGFITQTVTDRYGDYAFDDLEPGGYRVELAVPVGYRLSPRDAVVTDTLDSDFDPATGRTLTVTLTASGDTTVDAGLILPVVRFAQNELRLPEDAGTARVTVTLDLTPTTTVSVNYLVLTTTGTLTRADFTLADGALTFAPGQRARGFDVAITDDALYEPDEDLLIALDGPVHARLGDPANLTLVVLNDDAPPGARAASPCALDVQGSAIANVVDVADVQLAAHRLNQAPFLPEHDVDGNGTVEESEVHAIAGTWRGACDARALAWAQDSATGSRRVLLRWRADRYAGGPDTVFQVLRRPVGATQYAVVAEARFAPDPAALVGFLPQDVRAQLIDVDLDEYGVQDDVTLFNFLRASYYTHTAILAETYHQVAQGVGLAYLDTNPPAGAVEYKVVPAGQPWPSYGPVTIDPAAVMPEPKNVREAQVHDGPAELGVQNSARPFTATERFNWGVYEQARRAHGAAFLIWDIPGDADALSAGPRTNLNVAGYHVYRHGPASNGWELINAPLEQVANAHRLIRPGDPTDVDDPGIAAFLEDEVAQQYLAAQPSINPTLVFTTYQYQVCPVDLLGNQGHCADPVAVPIRDLDTPGPVSNLHVAVAPDHSVLTVTWAYSDVTEFSTPLRVFVSRSPTRTATAVFTQPTPTAPLTDWVQLTPQGLGLAGATPLVTMTLSDQPPLGEVFWYRAQVRDNAGNWSEPSPPAKGAIYTRTPPSLVLPFDPACDDTLPLTLSVASGHIGPEARQVVLYRAFEPISTTTPFSRHDKPFQIIRRFRVQTGTAALDDSYVPPYPATVYYRVEVLDGYGNVSAPAVICTRRNPGTPPEAPSITGTGTPVYDPDTQTYGVPLRVAGPEGGLLSRRITVYRASATDPTLVPGTTSGPVTTTHRVPVEKGETVRVEIRNTNANGDGPPAVTWVRETNDFMDTDRQMTDLGPPVGVEWIPGASPAVHVHVRGQHPDAPPRWEPWVALYRQIPGGNWLQVTPVQDLKTLSARFDPGTGLTDTWVISDVSDLSTNQDYRYMALAFSPLTFEVLGYWRPITLAAQSAGPEVIALSAPLAPAPAFTSTCGYDDRIPAYYGWPGQIALPHGWTLQVDKYRDYGGCDGLVLTPDSLYGYGWLTNGGTVSVTVDFVNIAVDGAWSFVGGRVVAALDADYGGLLQLPARYGQIEFVPGQANAAVTLTLPANVKVLDVDSGDRAHRVFGIFPNAGAGLSFGPLTVEGTTRPLALVDENLPWRVDATSFSFLDDAVLPNDGASTVSRLTYTPPSLSGTPLPDNNLALLRGSYTSADARVTRFGLSGTFARGALQYATSLPAASVVQASGATLYVGGSGIVSGTLADASVSLAYAWKGTDISYLSERTGELRVGYRGPNPVQHLRTLNSGTGSLAVGPFGVITGPLALSPADLRWTGMFTIPTAVPDLHVTYFAAGLAFNDSAWTLPGAGTAPLPAQNAWRRLPAPLSGADLDPGINVAAAHRRADYGCFRPSAFNDADFDLYVRRGGVSENFRLNAEAYGEMRDENGYLVTVKAFDALFVDNSIVSPTTALLDYRLPYPSDVTLPLRVSDFDARGCMAAADLREVLTVTHRYWAFAQTPQKVRLWTITNTHALHTDYVAQFTANNAGSSTADALRALPPRLLTIDGVGKINGLGGNVKTLAETEKPVDVPIASHWLPNGDYGDIHPYPEGPARDQMPEHFRVSGLPYAVRDVILSHYYSKLISTTGSLPDTMGLELGDTVQRLPSQVLDAEGKLTPASLLHCAETARTGCGFVVVDGNGAVDYFGEVEPNEDNAGTPPEFVGDAPQGESPIATTSVGGRPQQAATTKPQLTWAYPIVNDYIDLPIPVKLMANSAGGALAGVFADVRLLPGAEVIKTDLALVATVNFSDGFKMDFGIFAGYTAGPAAIRALAMNRPSEDGPGIAPFKAWDDVSNDAGKWAEKFEYSTGSGDKDDVLDLVGSVWSAWGTQSYTNTYFVLVDKIRALKGKEAYGVTGLQSGEVLKNAGTTLSTGLGQATFSIAEGDFRLENVAFGLMVDVSTGSGGGSSQQLTADSKKSKTNDALFHADWIAFEINRDGEVYVEGRNVSTSLTGDYDIHADIFLLIGTKPGFQRLEGGLTIAKLDLSTVVFRNMGVVFGAGEFNHQPLFYLGLRGEGDFNNYRVGAAILFGLIDPDSRVLKNAGFAELLSKIGGDGVKSGMQSPHKGTFAGIYMAVWGDVPIYNYSCIVNVTASAEVRFWYFTPTGKGDPIYGGYLRGSVYGTGLCLVHARGELTLSIEHLRNTGKSQGGRTCKGAEGCTAFSGDFWIAIGVGLCEPKNWVGWKNRWWEDDLCYTVGIQAEVTYIDPQDDKGDWDAALHPDAESF